MYIIPDDSPRLKKVKGYLFNKGHMCMESGTYDILYWAVDPFSKDYHPTYVPFKVDRYKIVYKKVVF